MNTLGIGRRWRSSLILWWAALGTLGGPLAAELLNVQFGTDGSTRKSGPAAVGQAPNDFWNRYSRDLPDGSYQTRGELADLKWADETTSGARLTLENAPGAWSNGFPDPMFGIYLYCFDGQPLTLTFNQLPPGTYEVLAYGHGGPPNVQNTAFELLSAGVSLGSGRTSSRPDWADTNWTAGIHYVRFSGVPVYTNHPLVLVSRPDAIPVALLNGIQLIRLNETPTGTPPTNVPPVDPPPGPTNTPPVPNGQPAGLLNVNFGVDETPIRQGPAAIGQAPDDFWNRYSRDNGSGGFRPSGSLSSMYWANGLLSGANLQVENAAGAWGNGVADPMFGVYLYPLSRDPNVRITLTDLPPGSYSVLVYAHGGPPDDHNTTVEVLSGHESYGNQTTATTGWNNTLWTEGAQYVRYTNLFVSEGSLTILAKPAGHSFGMINGLQVRLESALGLRIFPASELFTNEVTVRLVGAMTPQEIHYTLDGSTPTTNSPLYRVPFKLLAGANVQARLFAHGEAVGEVVIAPFQRVYAVDDGLSADWRRQYFGEGYRTDPRVSAQADPDGDGASNLQEFATGSDPLDPLSGFLVRTRLVPAVTWRSEPGVRYRLLRKDGLGDPQWQTVTEILATEPISRFVDADVANTDSFYVVEPVR